MLKIASMEEDEPKPHVFWLKLMGAIVVAVLVIGGAKMAYRVLMPKWLISKAVAAQKKGDLVSASLRIRRALQIDPRNPRAVRFVAEAFDDINAPDALFWRFRSFDLNQNLEQGTALVGCALKNGELQAARSTLEILRKRYGADAVLGPEADLALVEGRTADAATLYDRAALQFPKNEEYPYRAAHVRLLHGSFLEAQKAEHFLEDMAQTRSPVAVQASRALVDYCFKTGQIHRALRLNAQVLASPEAALRDKMTRLILLARTDPAQFRVFLSEMKSEMGKRAETAVVLINQLNQLQCQQEALEWGLGLTKEIARKPIVLLSMASIYLTLRDWQALAQFATTAAPWSDLEYMRLALMARAAREQGKEFRELWQGAMKKSAAQEDAGFSLAKTVTAWGWRDESKELCWKLAQTNGMAAKWALGVLYREALKERDVPELARVASRMVAINPADEKMTNNLAMFLLLNDEERSRPLRLSQDLYKKQPTVPEIASTYAFALTRSGDPKAALSILQSLGDQQLARPEIAFCMAIVLADLGQKERARPYVELAASRKDMFEQEIRLLKTIGWDPEN